MRDMKKLLVALVLSCIPAILFAQSNQYLIELKPYVPPKEEPKPEPQEPAPAPAPAPEPVAPSNKIAMGIGLGLDGVFGELAIALSQNLTFRVGYSDSGLISKVGSSRSYQVNSTDPWDIHGTIKATIRPQLDNVHLLLDMYPMSNVAFHFTLGGYYMLNGKSILHASTDQPLPIPMEQNRVTGIKFEQGGNTSYLTTDDKGYIIADARFGIGRIAPYAGIGFSRAVASEKVSILLDVGAIYTRSYEVYGYDYGINGTSSNPKAVLLTPDMVPGFDDNLVDSLQKCPIYPIIKLSLFFTLF